MLLPLHDAEAERYAGFLLSTLPELITLPVARSDRNATLDASLGHGFALGRRGLGIELGVYRGRSLRRAARRFPHRHFVGFDSLQGFPEDGRPDWTLDFTVPAPPRLPSNCELRLGWFHDTLPDFAATCAEPVIWLNIDCDIYSSAHQGLTLLRPLLRPGTVLHMDEALNYDGWLWNEMLALFRFLEATGMGVRWLARSGHVRDLPTTLAFLEAGRYPTWSDDVISGFHREAALALTPRNTALARLRESAPRSLLAEFGARLQARTRAYLDGSQVRTDCDPFDMVAPAPRLGSWRRLLRKLPGRLGAPMRAPSTSGQGGTVLPSG